MSDKTIKQQALSKAISDLEKTFGKGAVMRLGDNAPVEIEAISTGSIGLDAALGIGGFPKGRIVEIWGSESSGKTTTCLHAIAECQKSGGTAAFIDYENAFDPRWATILGVDNDSLIFAQPTTAEEGLEIVEKLISSSGVDIIVIDSVAAMLPKAELEGDYGDSKVGLAARLMSQAMRKLTGIIHRTNCCCIFINQTRQKIGVVYGSDVVTTGGNALKFYASQRLEIGRSGPQIKDKDGNVTANHIKVKVVKNKLASPFRTAEFDIEFGKGISKVGELIDLGESLGFVEKSGSWYSYGGAKIGQGRDNSKQFMSDNPEVADELEAKIREALANNR